jgi:peroxiredoxin
MIKKILLFCCLLSLLVPVAAFSQAQIGEPLPAFSGIDLQGNPVDLNKIIGKKPIMLLFWASWCKDCKPKLKEINKLVAKYGEKDIQFIGINIGMKDSKKKARAFIKEYKMTYPNVFDKTGELSEKYQLNKAFALILASKGGTVVMRFNNVPEFGDDTIEALNSFVPMEKKK